MPLLTLWPASIDWYILRLQISILFSLIYINDLIKDFLSTARLFTDDTSISSIFKNTNKSADRLNKDLQKNSDEVYQWKMSLNSNVSKQAQSIVFSRKNYQYAHLPVFLNNSLVGYASVKNTLALIQMRN